MTDWDPVSKPEHYANDPSGVECIQITRHRNFAIGSAMKYLWRAGQKADLNEDIRAKEIEDLEKSIWYIKDEIERLKGSVVDRIPAPIVAPDPAKHPVIIVDTNYGGLHGRHPFVWDGEIYAAVSGPIHHANPETITHWSPAKVVADDR